MTTRSHSGFQDEAATCDALSFGVGIDASPTGAPTTVVPAPETTKSCK